MNTAFFPLGVHKVIQSDKLCIADIQLCALDFKEENLARAPPLPLKERWKERMKKVKATLQSEKSSDRTQTREQQETSLESDASRVTTLMSSNEERPEEKQASAIDSDHGEGGEEPGELKQRRVRYMGGSMKRKTSRASSFTSMLEETRPIPPTAPLDAPNVGQSCQPGGTSLLPVCSDHAPNVSYHHPATPAPSLHQPSLARRLVSFGSNFLMPTTIALILALPCSLVLPIKALLVPVNGWTGSRIPNAPDDRPPLAFILETASFIGAITVPASLILLGASMARLTVSSATQWPLTMLETRKMATSTLLFDRSESGLICCID